MVNNAGIAGSPRRLLNDDFRDFDRVMAVNLLGVMLGTQRAASHMTDNGGGVIVNVTSTAGLGVYEGGGGYTAAKYAEHALTETLRLELCGEPVRVIEIAPGMVKTGEFSLVRFDGDQARADAVYAGVPGVLVADDIADCIAWTITRPWNVNIDLMVVRPRAQAATHKVRRES